MYTRMTRSKKKYTPAVKGGRVWLGCSSAHMNFTQKSMVRIFLEETLRVESLTLVEITKQKKRCTLYIFTQKIKHPQKTKAKKQSASQNKIHAQMNSTNEPLYTEKRLIILFNKNNSIPPYIYPRSHN